MKDLMKLANECMDELEAIGIEYGKIVEWKVNTRAKKRWGQCCKSNGEYKINISIELLKDDVSDKATKDTIMHEIIHTCKGCMNHGKEWKSIASLVNDCYGFYNIKTCTSAEEKGISREPRKIEYKYMFVCETCGQEIKRQKESKFTKRYKDYKCGRCHGNFIKVA